MNPIYLYHAFGVRHQECTKTEYKGNQNIHYIQTRKDELCCPECKSRKIIPNRSLEKLSNFLLEKSSTNGTNVSSENRFHQ